MTRSERIEAARALVHELTGLITTVKEYPQSGIVSFTNGDGGECICEVYPATSGYEAVTYQYYGAHNGAEITAKGRTMTEAIRKAQDKTLAA